MKAPEKCYKMSYACTLAHGVLWKYFGQNHKILLKNPPNIGKYV
jgi:hypothetical protein